MGQADRSLPPGKYQWVLVELAFYAKRGGDGIVFPSQQTIADNSGLSRPEVNGSSRGWRSWEWFALPSDAS